jgi:hypothetical protein
VGEKLLQKYIEFDGTANMRGEFNDLQAYIRRENPKSVYI